MKKIALIALIAILVLSLVACGRRNNAATTPSTTESSPVPGIDPTIMDPTFETNIPDPSVDTRMPDFTTDMEPTDFTENSVTQNTQ